MAAKMIKNDVQIYCYLTWSSAQRGLYLSAYLVIIWNLKLCHAEVKRHYAVTVQNIEYVYLNMDI